MEILPVEVITHVLKFLPSLEDRKACSLVCRSWYEAYQDPWFRQFEVLHISSKEKFKSLLQLQNEDRKYYYITIKETEIADDTLQFWDRFGPYIRVLSLLSCDIIGRTFVAILKKCKRLESLCVQSCRELFIVGNLFQDIKEKSVLKNNCNSILSLNLSHNRYLSDAVFVKFTDIFHNIKKLSLAGCQISFFSGLYKRYYPMEQVIPSENVFTFPMILNYLQSNSDRIEHLSFSNTFIDNIAISYLAQIDNLKLDSLHLRGCFQLSHGGIVSLSDYQKSLTELDVSLCPRITDGSLMAICSGLPNLITLSMQRCRAITDLGAAALWQLEKLRYLNLSECDSILGEGILKGICQRVNPDFAELRLSHLGNMPDDVVVALSKYLPNITFLDLGFCYAAVTDKSMQAILEHNRCLETLIVTMCDKLTDAGVTGMGVKMASEKRPIKDRFKLPARSLLDIRIFVREPKPTPKIEEMFQKSLTFSGFSLKTLKKLRTLNLSGCKGITDVSLMNAFELKELRHLDISHCNGITEKGLECLSRNNPAIEILNLQSCHGVNNNGVRYIVQNLKRLDTLTLGSDKINDYVASVLVQYAESISDLDMRQCKRVSIGAITFIGNSLPRLKNFQFSTYCPESAKFPPPAPQTSGFWAK